MAEAGSNLTIFLEACRKVLGSDHIVEGGDKLEEVSQDPVYTCHRPVASVYPGDTSDVSEVLKLASEYGISIWVYSIGKNWGYCNTAGTENCVLMILKRMNRIIEVDEELAYVELEPGVTYRQLNQYLRDRKIALWTDCTGGPPSGSVLGNAIDRGFGVTPYSDHYEQLCGMKVVLGNGSIISTGAFDENHEADPVRHTFERTAGPVVDGLFSQSNFGVVVRAGLWLMPEPETLELATLRLSEPDDLADALDAMRDLLLKGDLPGKGRFTNDIATLTLLTQLSQEGLDKSETRLTEENLQILRERHGIAKWTGAYGLYGSNAMVKAAKKQTSKRLKKFGRLTFINEAKVRRIEKIHKFLNGQSNSRLSEWVNGFFHRAFGCSLEMTSMMPGLFEIHQGIPNESVIRRAYFYEPKPRPTKDINPARDEIGLIWFVPLLPFRGREIVSYLKECREIYDRHGFDQSLSITPVNARTVVPLMVILYDKDDSESCAKAGELFSELQAHSMAKGYQQFRCGHLGWENLFDGNPELKGLFEDLKSVVDPSHVLAPGRYGIDGAQV